mmetsp:Transcript_33907/g.73367  ORF Transcript_33907/g.73367 Transcript_33907/m.73367 type:complete len:314 (-) Transcript_33907:723-1664(-)
MRMRDPFAFNLGMSLCNSCILPLFSQMCGPSVKGGPASAPSKRYGWLHTLRKCMSTFWRRACDGPPSALSSCASLRRMRLYQSCCISVRPMKSLVSFLGGREHATSFFTRRSMNGRRTVWSLRMTLSCPSFPSMENHWSNCSESPKISGSRKFNNAHSSCRLFCRGVPVMSSRNSVLSNLTALLRLEFSFLMRCASSMMRYFHGMRPRLVFSFNTASYEHTNASKLYLPPTSLGFKYSSRALFRSSFVPPMRAARMDGHHFLNSFIQFPTTDFGTMTMCGPFTPRASRMYARSDMVCNVLPNPISSANIPLMP